MRQGHRGANHPVKDLATGRVEITSQNHGFVVDRDTLPAGVEATHVSLFDGGLEGIRVAGKPVFGVQYHPEASPGPARQPLPVRPFRRRDGHLAAAHAETHGHRIHSRHRRRPDRHRPGVRVRLFRHPGLPGAGAGGLPRRAGELQPGDHHDRPRNRRRDLRRADHAGGRRAASSPARNPMRSCRRWAGRRDSTPPSRSPSRACWRCTESS